MSRVRLSNGTFTSFKANISTAATTRCLKCIQYCQRSRKSFGNLVFFQKIQFNGIPIWIDTDIHNNMANPPYSFFFSGPEKIFYWDSFSRNIKIWDAELRVITSELKGYMGYLDLTSIIVTSDGKRAAASSGPSLKIWDLETKKEMLFGIELQRGRPIKTLTAIPGSNRIASASSDGMIKIWDTTTGKEIMTLTKEP